MKRNFLPAVVVCLFLTLAGFSQNNLKINERQIKAFLETEKLQIEMPFVNNSKTAAAQIKIEILNPDDFVFTRAEVSENIKSGGQTVKIPVDFDKVHADSPELLWYRLRYTISPGAGADFAAVSGVVSLSEIMPEIFEIRAVGAERVVAGITYRVNVRAFQPVSGKASERVKITGEITLDVDDEKTDGKLKLTAQAATNAQGYALLNFKIPDGAKLDDDGDVKLKGEKNGILREAEQDLDVLEARNYVYLNTDKPIYQPGQDFHVRGWFLTQKNFGAENSQTRAGEELKFTIEDEDETTLYRETVKTSRFGIAAIDWKIPENAKLGTYRVKIEADDDLDYDQIYFKVSRYELPNFKVAAKPGKTYYLPNENTAEITVSADYLFGKPVAKGAVKVVRETDRRWNYKEQKWDIDEEEKYEGAADADGKFVAQVDLTKAHADLKETEYRRFEDLSFVAYFTDASTNRTEQKRFDVRVTKEAVHVYLVGIDSYSDKNPKLPVKFYVSTFYADGAPAECALEIKGKFENEDETETRNFLTAKTNRFGGGEISFIAPKPDEEHSKVDLQIKVFAADAQNLTGTQEEKISLDENEKQIQIETTKAVYHNGEAIDAEIVSSEPDADVFVDVAKNYDSVLESRLVKLVNGRASIKIPYRKDFNGEITVAAYFDDGGGDAVKDAKGIIYPAPTGLKFSAEPEKATYRPGEEAAVNFNVAAFDKTKSETALGVVVFDKAIDERARTDAQFGGNAPTSNAFGNFGGIDRDSNSFGAVTVALLNQLDPKAKIPEDLQLAAKILLAGAGYYPKFFESDEYGKDQHKTFENHFKKQFEPIEQILKNAYAADFTHPADENSLKQILSQKNIDFAGLHDPWSMPYLVSVETESEEDALSIRSSGADKIAGTNDDFVVLQMKFKYFTPTGNLINQAIENYHRQTGAFVRDYQTLRGGMLKQNVDLDALKDRFGRAYRYNFDADGRFYTLDIESSGKDGKKDEKYYGDDFTVWTNRVDYFAETELKIHNALNTYSNEQKKNPRDEQQFKEILRKDGVDFDNLRDGSGNRLYLTFSVFSRYADKVKSEVVSTFGANGKEKLTIIPVTQSVAKFTIKSSGKDGVRENGDDKDLTVFSGVLSEQSKDDKTPVETKVETIFTGGKGAVRGTIIDSNGAIIPGALVTATNEQTKELTIKTTNEDGFYLLEIYRREIIR